MRLILIFFISAISVLGQNNFGNYFLDKTLRVDYFETGSKNSDYFSIDKLIEEPYWGGSKVNLIDTLELGYYIAEVYSTDNNVLIYSHTYSTLFMEWQTTKEAETISRTFNGTITIPFPKDSVRLEIYKRNRQNKLIKKFEYVIDPSSYFITTEREKVFNNFKVHYSGDPSDKLDIVLLPEGYTVNEMDSFKDECNKIAENLFEYSPYKEMKDQINIWGVEAVSAESGSDIPGENIWKKTILNTSYYTFDTERYVMTSDYHAVRDVAANAPYDQIYIIVNSEKYGGGAIYNFYSCTAVKNKQTSKVFIHELGHGLAGLADEYYTSDVAYQDYYPLDVEPWEPNITTLVDFDSKWKNSVDNTTPIPTPDTEEYDGVTGVFEGAGYVEKGVYRPSRNSIMKTLSADGYNIPSLNALKKVINFYSNLIPRAF